MTLEDIENSLPNGLHDAEYSDSSLITGSAQSFFRSLWVNEWNAFVHIAATDARFYWVDESSVVEGAKS
jgi:hypothetical protein